MLSCCSRVGCLFWHYIDGHLRLISCSSAHFSHLSLHTRGECEYLRLSRHRPCINPCGSGGSGTRLAAIETTTGAISASLRMPARFWLQIQLELFIGGCQLPEAIAVIVLLKMRSLRPNLNAGIRFSRTHWYIKPLEIPSNLAASSTLTVSGSSTVAHLLP
jgi:hypothetical protein